MINILYDRLISDLKLIGIPFDFTLELKSYSKTYFGRYDPNKNKIILYIFEDSNCARLYPYSKLLDTLLHEFTHYMQYKNPAFRRVKGVMHDGNFIALYNYYRERVYRLKFWKEVRAS